jgi:hypothetical protein
MYIYNPAFNFNSHPQSMSPSMSNSELFDAVEDRNVDKIETLRGKHFLWNEVKDGKTALMLASEKGDKKIAKTLINCGASIYYESPEGKTAMLLAAENGHKDLIKLFIDAGFSKINCPTISGDTVSRVAAKNGDTEIYEILLDNNIIVNTVGSDGWTDEMIAAQHGNVGIMKLLSANDYSLNQRGANGLNPSAIAAREGQSSYIQAQYDEGVDANEPCRDGSTPAMYATFNGHEAAFGVYASRSDFSLTEIFDCPVPPTPEMFTTVGRYYCSLLDRPGALEEAFARMTDVEIGTALGAMAASLISNTDEFDQENSMESRRKELRQILDRYIPPAQQKDDISLNIQNTAMRRLEEFNEICPYKIIQNNEVQRNKTVQFPCLNWFIDAFDTR